MATVKTTAVNNAGKKKIRKYNKAIRSNFQAWLKAIGTFTIVTSALMPTLYFSIFLKPLIDAKADISLYQVLLYLYFIFTGIWGFAWGIVNIRRGYNWTNYEITHYESRWLWWGIAHALLGALPLTLHHVAVWWRVKNKQGMWNKDEHSIRG